MTARSGICWIMAERANFEVIEVFKETLS